MTQDSSKKLNETSNKLYEINAKLSEKDYIINDIQRKLGEK